MSFNPGDHVCALYSTTEELAREAATFLAEGLRGRERCWYVAGADETDAVRAALERLGIDVAGQTRRGALQLVSGDGAYVVHGQFDPEATLQIFNDAIERAYDDGFSGFRAAAEMSWALDCEDGAHQLIAYEALLKSLFASCRAIGLCLYHRARMPLAVLDGALQTHPVAGSRGHYRRNPFYEPGKLRAAADVEDVRRRIALVDQGQAC